MEKIKVLEYCNKYNEDIMDVISKYCNFNKQIYTVKFSFLDKEYVFIYEHYVLDCDKNMFNMTFDLKQFDTTIFLDELKTTDNVNIMFLDGLNITLKNIENVSIRTTENPSDEIHNNVLDISFGSFETII